MSDDFMEELRKDFLVEASFLLEQCEESYLSLEQEANRKEELDKIFRMAHSMKGAGAAVGFEDLSAFAHKVEDCLAILRVSPHLLTTNIISLLLKCGDAFKKKVEILQSSSNEAWDVTELASEIKVTVDQLNAPGGAAPVSTESPAKAQDAFSFAPSTEVKNEESHPSTEPVPTVASAAPAGATTKKSEGKSVEGPQQAQSVKVDTDRIEGVLDLVGELVVIKSQLMEEMRHLRGELRLDSIASLLDKGIRELQDRALGMRMTPLKPVFLKTQRIVRDLSVRLQKPVDFVMTGEDTEIDRTMVELLTDPLMHIARNALDHGIEKPALRAERKKNAKGTIHISAKQAGSKIQVRIEDDGGGIDRKIIFNKAIENGVIPADSKPEAFSDKDVYQFIFLPGFSTAAEVTDVSGRGVGMDVVKSNLQKIKGEVEIVTNLGKGTIFNILIPITTSISDGIKVMVSGQPFVIPMDAILELVDLKEFKPVDLLNGNRVIPMRGRMIPLIDMQQALAGACKKLREDQPQEHNVGKKGMAVVIENNLQKYALMIDEVVCQIQVVLKPLGESFGDQPCVAGAAILGDGKVALVVDVSGFSKQGVAA